ncbi:MAG: CapA family protein [Clostridiales bacterium]|nr:CapA family protein [Clostridiales bacterium]
MKRIRAAAAVVALAAIAVTAACAKTAPRAADLTPTQSLPPVVTESSPTPEMTPEPSPEPTPEPTPEPIVIAVAGDILTGERIGPRIEAGEYEEVLDAEMAELMRNADVTVINYESSISTRGTPADKTYTFRAKPEHTAFLRNYLGVDAASLATNNTLD